MKVKLEYLDRVGIPDWIEPQEKKTNTAVFLDAMDKHFGPFSQESPTVRKILRDGSDEDVREVATRTEECRGKMEITKETLMELVHIQSLGASNSVGIYP